MALVTFNENVDHYAKGDVVDLDKDELKRIDEYAETNGIEKPYAKGAKEVSNTTDTPSLADQAREDSLASSADSDNVPADATTNEDAGTVGVDADELVDNANEQATSGEETTSPDASDETPAEGQSATDAASELPVADETPATDEGNKPSTRKK